MLYKSFKDFNLSEIGIGTYLGNTDDQTDIGYYETIREGIKTGINVVDTAINYRNMRSERVIGEVLEEIGRNKVVVSTKGGYIPLDDRYRSDPQGWFKSELIDRGIISKEDITPYGNVLTVKYIDWSFNYSLKNLKTSYIDIYFLHNPEDQLNIMDRPKFYERLRLVFSLLEEKVEKGELKYYGLATWNGFRVNREHRQFLDLYNIYKIAESIGGKNHHFRFIQLPYNLEMTEAFTIKNQLIDGVYMSTLEAAEKLDIYTYISAPLFQRRLLRNYPENVKSFFKVKEDFLVPIQFVRSTPGVGTVLIGMSKVEHLLKNVEIEKYEKLSSEDIRNLLDVTKR